MGNPRSITAGPRFGRASLDRQTRIEHAAILTLRAAPVTLIPAPGAGRAIVVEHVDILLDGSGTAYTETADNLAVQYSGGTDVLTIEATGFLDQNSVEFRTARPAIALVEPVANQAVELFNSGDGELGGGEAGQYMQVTCRYRVVDVA